MISFEDEFFKGEKRDDFYIESLMKKNWAVGLDMIQTVAEICDKHNIRWFADSGTLLGAVRHSGFIPWDDDVDIVMPREDLNKFATVAREELPDRFVFLEGGVDCESEGSVVRNRVMDVSTNEEIIGQYYGFPYVVNLDIFPLDDVTEKPELLELEQQLLQAVAALFSLLTDKETDREIFFEQYKHIQTVLGLPYEDEWINESEGQLKTRLWYTYNMIGQIGNGTGAREWGYPHWVSWNRGSYLKKEWYRDTVDLQFENITVKAPLEYEKVLSYIYGPNWKNPVNVGGAHNYPCYNQDRFSWEKRQARMLLSQVLSQTTGQSVDEDAECIQISYDDDFGVYEIEVDGKNYLMIIPTADYTASDNYVYDEVTWIKKKDAICANMNPVLYDGGVRAYVCGIKNDRELIGE